MFGNLSERRAKSLPLPAPFLPLPFLGCIIFKWFCLTFVTMTIKKKVLCNHVSIFLAHLDLLSSRHLWAVLPCAVASVCGGSGDLFGISIRFSFAWNRELGDCFSDLNSLYELLIVFKKLTLIVELHFKGALYWFVFSFSKLFFSFGSASL